MIGLAEKALSHAILRVFAISASDPLMWLHAALSPLVFVLLLFVLGVTERSATLRDVNTLRSTSFPLQYR